VLRLRDCVPIETRCLKGRGSIWVRNALAIGRIPEKRELIELGSAAGGDRRRQVFFEVTEEEKGRFRSEFFTHEDHGHGGSKQENRRGGTNGARVGELGDALAKGAVSYLIMILKEGDERGGGQIVSGLTAGLAVPESGGLALIRKASDEATT
jgi:hypothetical protein